MIYIGTFKDIDNSETYQVTINAGTNLDEEVEVTKTFEEADFHFSPDPVHITCERSDLTQLIMITQCQIKFKSKDDLSKTLLANTNRQISVTVERVNLGDNDILFYGYVDPLQFNQGFAHNYEEIVLNCTDPLGALEQLYIQDTSIVESNSMPMINFINAIFDKIFENDTDKYNGIKTFFPNKINPNNIKVNAGIFYGEDEDDRMTLYDTLLELLKYLGCTVAYEPASGAIHMFNIYNVPGIDGDNRITWFDAKNDAMDDSGALSFDEAYNKITLTCEIEPVEDEIKLIDDDIMYSDYDNYQKYMTELVSLGEGSSAYNGFQDLLNTEQTNYDGGYKLDHYCYVKRSPAWTFGPNSYITSRGGTEGDNPQPMSGDQSDVLTWLKDNPCKAAFVSFGKGNKINYKDNSPVNSIPLTDYLVISICGHNDHAENGHNNTMFNQIQANAPLCKYTGLQSLNLTPMDKNIINYIVISGKLILNPLQRKTGPSWDTDANWPGGDLPSNLYNASTNTFFDAVNALSQWENYYYCILPSMWHKTVWHPDNGDGAYYTQKWWKLRQNATPRNPDYVLYPYNGIFGYLDNKSNEILKYSWTTYGDETDVISKLPILACQLKVGDKYCVERLDKGMEGQGVFEWMTQDQWNASPLKRKGFDKPYFTIGIDIKTDDKIVGRSYSIQNNISYTMNVDGTGTAIPIKMSDKLNGVPEFSILGPINQMWNEIERIHPSFWRHTSWNDHKFWTLELLDSILISDLKIELKSDNAKINSKKTTADNDLMYYSAESINYTELLEEDIKICTPLTLTECQEKGIKYQQSNSYVLKTNNEPFYGWGYVSDPIKPEELYIDYLYKQYCEPAQIIEFCVDNGWAFGTPTTNNSFFGFSTALSQYTIQMQYPGIYDPLHPGQLLDKRYYCMSMDWSVKNRENNMKVREVLPYENPFT